MRRSLMLVMMSAVLLGACQGEEPLEQADWEASPGSLPAALREPPGGEVTVMTRNLYIGTNIDAILAAPSPEEVPARVAEAFALLLRTDFPTRAKLLADEIARARPHLIGLQEVALIRIQSPGDAIQGGGTPAQAVFLDYLAILLAELRARGLDYRAVARVQNGDVELPMLTSPAPTFDDVRLTDSDVILARADVSVSNVTARNYQSSLVLPSPLGSPVSIPRGFVAVDAVVGRKSYRFANTHLQPAFNEESQGVQLLQALELLLALEAERLPVILVGDFNTPANLGPSAAPTYAALLLAGYVDVWTRQRPRPGPGLTCCHAPDLSNELPTLTRRIDLILVRNNALPLPWLIGPVRADVVGDEPEDRAFGLWPSDHAGVVATLRIPTWQLPLSHGEASSLGPEEAATTDR